MKCERCNDREALPFAPACASCYVDRCGPSALYEAARRSAFEEAVRALHATPRTRVIYTDSNGSGRVEVEIGTALDEAEARIWTALAAKERTP